MKTPFIAAILWFVALSCAVGQTFTEQILNTTPRPDQPADFEWIDIDNDNDLDAFVFAAGFFQLYRNTSGTMSPVSSFLTGSDTNNQYSAYAFGDHDLDGDIDFLITRQNQLFVVSNNGNATFTLQPTGVNSSAGSALYWFDVDGDADLDVAYDRTLFFNSAGVYTNSNTFLPVTIFGYQSVDLNHDGMLELICVQESGLSNFKIVVYENAGRGVFRNPIIVTDNFFGTVAWLDADNDNDIDLVMGEITSSAAATVFKNKLNESGSLSFERSFTFGNYSSPLFVAGDFDLDGRPDLIVHENINELSTSNVYRNISATDIAFEKGAAVATAQRIRNIKVIDFNRDGKPDVFLSGLRNLTPVTGRLTNVYLNNIAGVVPSVATPTTLQSVVQKNVVLSWAHNQANKAVYYNLEIYRNGSLYKSSFAKATGSLIKPDLIKPVHGMATALYDLPAGNYEWRVQAINYAQTASPFSASATFVIGPPPQNLSVQIVGPSTAKLTWTYSESVTSFVIYRKTGSSAYEELVTLSGATSMYSDANLPQNQTYRYYVRAIYNGVYSPPSEVASFYSGVFEPSPLSPGFGGIVLADGLTADLDSDGDYDVGVIDLNGGESSSTIYVNDGLGNFSPGSFLPAEIQYSKISHADYDRDGDVDICVVGTDAWLMRVMLFKNEVGVFSKVYESQAYVDVGQLAFEDINQDGFPDLLFSHTTSNSVDGPRSYQLLYGAPDATFVNSGINFMKDGYIGRFNLVDLNNDGFTDVLFPRNLTTPPKIWKNLKGQGFVQVNTNLPPILAPSYIDANADGYVDIVQRSTAPVTFYPGNGDFTFQAGVSTGILITENMSIEVADIDLNGWPDWIVSDGNQAKLIHTGPGNLFTTSDYMLGNLWSSKALLINLENDNDIDLLRFTSPNTVYKNRTAEPNSAPSIPQGLQRTSTTDGVTFEWLNSEDDKTPSKLLSYNISVRNNDGIFIVHPGTNESGQFQRRFGRGNAGTLNLFKLNDLAAGQYHVSVQALDASFTHSSWSQELDFTVHEGPKNLDLTRIELSAIELKWEGGPQIVANTIVLRKTSTSEFMVVATLAPGVTNFTDQDLELEKLYTYQVIEVVGGNYTAGSNRVEWNTTVLVEGVSSLPDFTGSMDVGDFTNDGKMDLLILDGGIGKVFENTGNGWTVQAAGSTETIGRLSLKFQDINADQKLDLYDYRTTSTETFRTETFKNNGDKTFSAITTTFSTQNYELAGWWDYDHDNDLDAYVAKADGTGTQGNLILKNKNDGNFETAFVQCASCNESYLFFGDFDNNGTEDFVRPYLSGYGIYLDGLTGNSDVEDLIPAGYIEQNYLVSKAYPIDYNGDGLLDILFTSNDWFIEKTKLYKNTGLDEDGNLTFEQVLEIFPLGYEVDVNWIDYDHDGDIDLILTGEGVQLFQNTGENLSLISTPSLPPGITNVRWIDVDDDGDLDLIGSGPEVNRRVLFNQVVTDGEGVNNSGPPAPVDLLAAQDSIGLHLTWTCSGDDHTPDDALTADVILYRNAKVITKALVDGLTGIRLKYLPGRNDRKALVNSLAFGEHKWKVQAVDQSYRGSMLSSEGSFIFRPPQPVIETFITLYICDGKGITAEGENIEWFSDREATQLIASGNEFFPQESQVVFVTQTLEGVRGIVKYVKLTVAEFPPAPLTPFPNPLLYCEPELTLSRSLTVEGEDVRWYGDSTKLFMLEHGPTLRIVTTDQTLYVTQTIQDCESKVFPIIVEGIIIESTIQETGGQLMTLEQHGDHYEWFYNEEPVPNSNQNFIDLSGAGLYSVTIQKGHCLEVSEPYLITGNTESVSRVLKISPNPVSDKFKLLFPGASDEASIEIFDGAGREVYSAVLQSQVKEVIIDASAWHEGLYIIRVMNKSKTYIGKIVRQN